MKLKTIGYPFIRTQSGLFNPQDSPLRNARNKIINLLSTNKGQRIMSHNCQFGINIQKFLFQNVRYGGFQKQLQNQVEKTIKRWIKQIDQIQVNVKNQQHSLIISIEYKVMQQNDILNMEFDLQNVE